MTYCDLHHLIDGLRLFPDPNDVFARDVALHCRYLLPLATIDLSLVNPEFSGKAHFIQPIEPQDGVVGEGGDEYFTYHTRRNFVGYVYDGDRCVFDGDFHYFERHRLGSRNELTERESHIQKCYDDHYRIVRDGYDLARNHVSKYGMLHKRNSEPPYTPSDRLRIAMYIGGRSEGGNWASDDGFPIDWGRSERNDGGFDFNVAPLTADERRFEFVGQIPVYCYVWSERSTLSCDLVMFFDPVDRVALTTFDWS